MKNLNLNTHNFSFILFFAEKLLIKKQTSFIMLTNFDLCTGVGGSIIAGEWAGIKTIGMAENAPFQSSLLKQNWPEIPNFGDIKNVNSKNLKKAGIGQIDIISGGFPCQPFSLNGRRMGASDERNLWRNMRRTIRSILPRWIMFENVPGLLTIDSGLFFSQILNDLAEMGYQCGWACYEASHTGAPHHRERVFILGYNWNPKTDTDSYSINDYYHRLNSNTIRWQQRQKTGLWNSERTGICWNFEPNVERVANGIPNQLDRLEALGNAIVPQQIYPFYNWIAHHDIQLYATTK